MIPNLTGRIKIVKGPLCAGGFCDIYSGELMSERGTEPVAMKMLRVFNTEAHVVQAKKVSSTLTFILSHQGRESLEIPTRSQPLVLATTSLRTSFLWDL
jgi:hypothetical protein